jgi:hypothetical protein
MSFAKTGDPKPSFAAERSFVGLGPTTVADTPHLTAAKARGAPSFDTC